MTFLIKDFVKKDIKLKVGDPVKIINDQNSEYLVETALHPAIKIPKDFIVQILPAQKQFIPSFYQTLTEVAREKIYLEMIEPPSFEDTSLYQERLILKKLPALYAIVDHKVVGWCDVTPFNNPRMSHRGSLGMGVLASYRSLKIGKNLLIQTLNQTQKSQIEKVELHVYTHNTSAISLYKKMGFKESGLIKHYRKLDNIYYDALEMELFIENWKV